MDRFIIEAYVLLYDKEPEPKAEEWQIASEILGRWNVPKLGEDLATETLFRIINHTPFPSEALTKAIVGEAEDKIVELLPEIGIRDPHMDLIAELERKYHDKKKIELEKKSEIKIK